MFGALAVGGVRGAVAVSVRIGVDDAVMARSINRLKSL